MRNKSLDQHFREQAELIDRLFAYRFQEFDNKWEAKLDARFETFETKLDSKLDARFAAFEDRLDAIKNTLEIVLKRLP